MGFIEPSSGDSKSAQLVGWDTCSLEYWRAASPNTAPAGFDINMDAVYCLPQLSGENFLYMRLPHVSCVVYFPASFSWWFFPTPHESRGVLSWSRWGHFCSPPGAVRCISCTPEGAAPGSVPVVRRRSYRDCLRSPPPPARGRSMAREPSQVRDPPAAPAAPAVAPPVFFGCLYLPDPLFLYFLPILSGHLPNPHGAAASDHLAQQRNVRIQAERSARRQPTAAEQAEARRQRRIDRELGEFMSTASVVTAEDLRVERF